MEYDHTHRSHWYRRQQPGQSEKVDGPHVVIAQALPEHYRRQSLTVVHVTFAGIVSQNTIHHDFLLPLVEPPFEPTELGSCLSRRRWQVPPGHDADESSQCSLECEEPPPSFEAVEPCHVENAVRHERGNDTRGLVGYPEKRQPSWELLACVPVRQVENIVRYEATFNQAKEGAASPERASSRKERLAAGYETP